MTYVPDINYKVAMFCLQRAAGNLPPALWGRSQVGPSFLSYLTLYHSSLIPCPYYYIRSHLSFQGPYFVSSIYFPLLFNAFRSFSIILPKPSIHCHYLTSSSPLPISFTPLAWPLSSYPCPPHLPPPGCVTSVLTLPSWQQLGMTTRWRKSDELEVVRAILQQIDLDKMGGEQFLTMIYSKPMKYVSLFIQSK